MRRLAAALLCLLALSPAYAQKTKTQLNTEINTNLPDNVVGAITPALVRATLLDMVASWLDLNGTGAFNCAVNQWANAFSNLSTPSCAQPAFSNLSGNIAISQMNSGTGASATTVWKGDGTWGTVSGVGTVTEQKNTAGPGLTTSGNCDNTASNAGSPCQYNLSFVPFAYLAGLTLANDATTPATVLDIAAGQAADSTNAALIPVSAFTKTISGPWVAGSGNAGMGAGLTVAAGTFYHVCLAHNSGTADVWFDTSAVCANRPAGISDPLYRRIGSFGTNASAQIIAFTQNGDYFWRTATVIFGPTAGNIALGQFGAATPPGVICQPLLTWQIASVNGTVQLQVAPGANSALATPVATLSNNNAGVISNMGETVGPPVNAAGNIYISFTVFAGTSPQATVWNNGWIDTRGK